MNLAQEQRILVNDTPTGWALGESFLATTSSSTLTCTTVTISDGTLSSLSGLLTAGDVILSGWSLSATIRLHHGQSHLSFV